MTNRASDPLMRRVIVFASLVLAVAACGDPEVQTGPARKSGSEQRRDAHVRRGSPLPPRRARWTDRCAGRRLAEADILRGRIASRPQGEEDGLPPTGWRVLADNQYGVFYGAGQPPRMAMVTVWRGRRARRRPERRLLLQRYREGYEAGRWVVHGGQPLDSEGARGRRPRAVRAARLLETGCSRSRSRRPTAVTFTFWIEQQSGFQTARATRTPR